MTADGGFDWDMLNQELRDEGFRPVIKHRVIYGLQAAHNAWMDDATYHRGPIVEATFSIRRNRVGLTILGQNVVRPVS